MVILGTKQGLKATARVEWSSQVYQDHPTVPKYWTPQGIKGQIINKRIAEKRFPHPRLRHHGKGHGAKTHRGHGPKIAAARTRITIAAVGIKSEMKTSGIGPMYEVQIPVKL